MIYNNQFEVLFWVQFAICAIWYYYFTLFEKSNFCQKIQFWQYHNIFTSFPPKLFLTILLVKSKLSTAKKSRTKIFSRVFHPKFFWQFFSWNQSCQQLKSPKPQHFHEFFTQKNRQFSWEIKVEFLDKKWRFRTVCKYCLN